MRNFDQIVFFQIVHVVVIKRRRKVYPPKRKKNIHQCCFVLLFEMADIIPSGFNVMFLAAESISIFTGGKSTGEGRVRGTDQETSANFTNFALKSVLLRSYTPKFLENITIDLLRDKRNTCCQDTYKIFI